MMSSRKLRQFAFLSTLLSAMLALFTAYGVQAVENSQKIAKNEPLFRDGKGYYSYHNAVKVPLPQDGRVLIQYFFKYACAVCLSGDDHLKQYVALHPDKVVLQRSPAFEKGDVITAQIHDTFIEYGRPELSDLYLFDSIGRKEGQSLIKNDKAITQWLVNHGVEPRKFQQVYQSDAVRKRMEQDVALYQKYSPPFIPIAVLNGKYILLHNTLYNDDYTYAVLDFLVEKLQQEQQKDKK